ncbi:MAG: sensor histidine kinase [Alphaproteobacteria bacterium]|nr:sensor histidine kinase [Alphaproteobacteria bacterium]
MALDTDKLTAAGNKLLNLRDRAFGVMSSLSERIGLDRIALPAPIGRFVRSFAAGGAGRQAIVDWFNRQPLVRFISRSLLRRIIVSNLIGFLVLFGGILYLSLDSSWIINAKSEALKTQGQIIAAAIASNAKVKKGQISVDPDRLPNSNDSLVPFRKDAFAALKLSILPERVAPIFRKLTEPTKTRARIYDRRGNLVVDTKELLKKGQIGSGAVGSAKDDKFAGLTLKERKQLERENRPNTKTFWTRLQHLLIGREVQVYREIGDANGQLYPEVRRALKGENTAMLLLNDSSQQIVSVAIPIQSLQRVMGVLLLSTPPGEIDKVLAESRNDLWPLALVALAASLLTAWFLEQTVAGPMKRLSMSAEELSHDISAQTQLPQYADRKDEVGQMAQAFAKMTNSLYERIEASEKFAADVAHELKNPLTAASSMSQSLEYAKTEEDRQQVVYQIQQELKRLNRLISDVSKASMLNAQLQRETAEPVDLKSVLSDVSSIFSEKAEGAGKTLKYALKSRSGQIMVSGNGGRLGQVFTNLIDNALSFSPEGGTVQVTARIENGDVVVTVDDEGPGIQDDKLETIFSRFYTYRPTADSSRGNNSGLGLSISQEIIQSHHGKIWAENRYAGHRHGDSDNQAPIGARFIVRLPIKKPLVARNGSRTG